MQHIRDIHDEDPEFGYRFIADELRAQGVKISERRVWRLCSRAQVFSVIARRKPRGKQSGAPVHDDLLQRHFHADEINVAWVTDITEHWTREGKLYLCAIKDLCSRAIVGYATSSRMESSLAVAALEDAMRRRGEPKGVIIHSDRGSQGGFNWLSQHLDEKGVSRWLPRTGVRRPVTCPQRCVGSGVRIGPCGHRCAPLGARHPRGRCSVSSGR